MEPLPAVKPLSMTKFASWSVKSTVCASRLNSPAPQEISKFSPLILLRSLLEVKLTLKILPTTLTPLLHPLPRSLYPTPQEELLLVILQLPQLKRNVLLTLPFPQTLLPVL